MEEVFDLAIVGAGISGINTAYRFRAWAGPSARYVILDERDAIGGTWNMWKYPGVRCDTNISTMAFPWHNRTFPGSFVEGRLINEYLRDAAAKHRIDEHIRFHHKVQTANWSSEKQQWHLSIDCRGDRKQLAARFVVIGTGFLDYEAPLSADIPGLDRFQGRVINPRFWPSDYDYTNQKIAVIGSGATAVSLVPALPEKAAEVTMIQRSPTDIVPFDNRPPVIYRCLPLSLANAILRVWHMVQLYLIVRVCLACPGVMRKALRQFAVKLLPEGIDYDVHLKPTYPPWEQRMCVDPDGVFFRSLHRPNVKLVTGEIERVTETGIEMQNGGATIEADAIVAATGLRMGFGGNIAVRVDGEAMPFGDRFMWNGAMLDGVPNLMIVTGFADNSWTLSAEDTAFILTRLLGYMKSKGVQSATPRVPRDAAMETQCVWRSTATSVRLAEGHLPVCGTQGPWRPKYNPVTSWIHARWGDITSGLEFSDK